jgi:Bacterial protein of unknown function (DUF899)
LTDQERDMNLQLTPATELAAKAKTPFPGASPAYEAARKALLADEIEFRRHMTRLGQQRRALPPGPVITKDYRFKDEQAFEVGLKDLFGDKDTLVTYFWMYGPQRERPCPMCTNWLGSVNGNAADIKQRVALKTLGRYSVARQWLSSPPLPTIAFHKRSVSAWSSVASWNGYASLCLKSGPPLSPTQGMPRTVNSTVSTSPSLPAG